MMIIIMIIMMMMIMIMTMIIILIMMLNTNGYFIVIIKASEFDAQNPANTAWAFATPDTLGARLTGAASGEVL